jgi:hypothetical protein
MATQDYLDFELNIEDLGNNKFRIAVGNSPVGSASIEINNPFQIEEITRILGVLERTIQTTRAERARLARAFGEKLFNAIFTGDIYAAYLASKDRASALGLRIKLSIQDAGMLEDVPWELLRDPRNDYLVLSRQTPIVRYPRILTVRPLVEITLPMRVLVMISSPGDQEALDVEGEWRALEEATLELRNRGLLVLDRLDDAQLVTLQRKLREDTQFHVFHYIGHAAFDEQSKTGMLAFENARSNTTVPVSGESLARELSEENTIRLVVLNACQGARQDNVDPFAGIASSIVARGVPAVVAMQFSISDDASKIFSQEFYKALAEGYSIEAATSEARRTISGSTDDLEWATPVLYLRAPTGVLFPKRRSGDTARASTGGLAEAIRSPIGIVLTLGVVGICVFMFLLVGPLKDQIFPPPTSVIPPTSTPDVRDVDLVITTLRVFPANPGPGAPVEVTSLVRNDGSTDSGAFKWSWFTDDPQSPNAKPAVETEVTNIAPGTEREVSVRYFFPRWTTLPATTAWINFDGSVPERTLVNNFKISPRINIDASLNVDFSKLPNQQSIAVARDLAGNEFEAWGFQIAAVPRDNSGCTQPVVRVNVEANVNQLGTRLANDNSGKCSDMPISFTFDGLIGGATVEFVASAAGTYTLELTDATNKKQSSTVQATGPQTLRITAPSDGNPLFNGRKVVFSGPAGAKVVINRVSFSQPGRLP